MEILLTDIFKTNWYPMLTGFLGLALFFAMMGLRDLRDQLLEGFLFLALSVFFFSSHLYLLLEMSAQSSFGSLASELTLWIWLALIFAPALIVLFILLGIFSLLSQGFHAGLVKLFFGLTLLCYLFMVGSHWPADCKGIMAMIYGGVWFNLELRTT